MSNTIEITAQDLQDGTYVFASDVVAEFQLGVSPKGHTDKEPVTKVNLQVSYEGANLADILSKVDYQFGVNARRSLREHGWMPKSGSIVNVLATNNASVKMDALPPKVQALAYFSKIEDEAVRKNAIKAFLASQ